LEKTNIMNNAPFFWKDLKKRWIILKDNYWHEETNSC
jgi:hypothetical protein